MPRKDERKLVRKIEREYERKGYELSRAKHIANATVYGHPSLRKHFGHKLLHPTYHHPNVKHLLHPKYRKPKFRM